MKTTTSNFLQEKTQYSKECSKFSFTVFFLLIFSFVLNAQSKDPLPLDNELKFLPIDTVLVKLTDAVQNMDGKNDLQIKQVLFKTLARAKASNNPLYIAKANQQLANWHYGSTSSEVKDSIYHYDKQALTFFLQTKENELITRAYRNVGTVLLIYDLLFLYHGT